MNLKSDEIRETVYNRCVRIVEIFFSDAANVYSTIALTRLGLNRPRIMFIIKIPERVDFKTYLTCYHEIHTLKIIDLSDLDFMHPALGKTRDRVNVTQHPAGDRQECLHEGRATPSRSSARARAADTTVSTEVRAPGIAGPGAG